MNRYLVNKTHGHAEGKTKQVYMHACFINYTNQDFCHLLEDGILERTSMNEVSEET